MVVIESIHFHSIFIHLHSPFLCFSLMILCIKQATYVRHYFLFTFTNKKFIRNVKEKILKGLNKKRLFKKHSFYLFCLPTLLTLFFSVFSFILSFRPETAKTAGWCLDPQHPETRKVSNGDFKHGLRFECLNDIGMFSPV